MSQLKKTNKSKRVADATKRLKIFMTPKVHNTAIGMVISAKFNVQLILATTFQFFSFPGLKIMLGAGNFDSQSQTS
jgi:hypothetical protein